MTNEDRAVFRALLEASEAGRPCALATVVATRGSTPRKNGAKMVVDPHRGLVGTVGGGCGEAEVIRAAGEAMETGLACIVKVDLTDDPLAWTGSVCGGVLDVFVEPVLPAGGRGGTPDAGGPTAAGEASDTSQSPNVP